MIFIKLLDMHLETRFSLPFRLNKDSLKLFSVFVVNMIKF